MSVDIAISEKITSAAMTKLFEIMVGAGWSADLLEQVLKKDHSPYLSQDAFNELKGYLDYSDNAELTKLFNDFGLYGVQLDKTAYERIDLEDALVGITNKISSIVGLGQVFDTGIYTAADSVNNISHMAKPTGRYLRMVNVEQDGSLTDTGKIMTSVNFSNTFAAALAACGYQVNAGVAEKMAQQFLAEYQNNSVVKKYIENSRNLTLLDGGNNNDKVSFYIPAELLRLIGEYIKEHLNEIQGGPSEKLEPVIDTEYNASNPLPVRLMTADDFKLNYPSGASATIQGYYNDLQTALGSMDALAYNIYNSAMTDFETAFNNNATMVSRYGTFDAKNFYEEIRIYFDTYNSFPRLNIEVRMIPIYFNRSGASGLKFLAYDDTYLNNGEMYLGTNLNVVEGKMEPYGNVYWDTLLAYATAWINGTITTNQSMGNPSQRIFGISVQQSQWWLDNLLSEASPNPDFREDPDAELYEEDSPDLDEFVNDKSGQSNIFTYIQDAVNTAWTLLNPVLNAYSLNNEDLEMTQQEAVEDGIPYEDLDEDKNNQTIASPVTLLQTLLDIARDIANNAQQELAPELDPDTELKVDLPGASTETKAAESDMPGNADKDTPVLPELDVETGNAGSFITAYKVTETELNHLGKYLWTTSFFDLFKTIGQSDAISSAIIGLMDIYAPYTMDVSGNTSSANLKVAGINILDSGNNVVTAGKFTNRIIKADNIATFIVEPLYRNYLDYQCTFDLYLPGCSFVSLDPADVFTGSGLARKIQINMTLDVFTGDVCYTVLNPDLIGVYSGNVSINTPISQRSYSAAIGAAASTLMGIATNNPVSAVSGGLNFAQNMFGNVTTKGSLSSSIVALGPKDIYLKRTRPVMVNDMLEISRYRNYPDYRTVYLANLKGAGFCQIMAESLRGSFSATEQELDEIKSLLESGVIL